MGKRRLSLQQERRIRAERARALAANPHAGQAELRRGVVVARFGKALEVIDPDDPLAPPRRCHMRANLEPVVGDHVLWQTEAGQGIVTALAPRRTLLRRREGRKARVIAANVDQLAIVIAAQPEPHPALVDRLLAAAEIEHIHPLLVINKCDLPGTRDLLEIGESRQRLGYPLLQVSARTGLGVDALRAHLEAKTSVFCGQSGVGKSSLLNCLFPNAPARVGSLSEATPKGRHTTTVSRYYPLTTGAVIDSPGIREFDVACADESDLMQGFVDLRLLAAQCRFRNCSHREDPGCALVDAAAHGRIDPQRLESFHQLRLHYRMQP